MINQWLAIFFYFATEPDKNFEKVKDQTPNEKVQLLIKLEKYNHINQEEVIEKHINQVDRNDDDNHLEHEYEQSSYINLPTINANDFLMYYANETEKQNNINHKKKKKQERNNQMRRQQKDGIIQNSLFNDLPLGSRIRFYFVSKLEGIKQVNTTLKLERQVWLKELVWLLKLMVKMSC